MNKRVLQIALKISLIEEEFSQQEIADAIKLLEKCNSSEVLLEYLAKSRRESASSNKETRSKNQSDDQELSKILKNLEHENPKKYKILSTFLNLVRRKKILPALTDIEDLGKILDENFTSSNSRPEGIKKLIAVMTKRPIEEVEVITNKITSGMSLDGSYQDLAKFIIKGH